MSDNENDVVRKHKEFAKDFQVPNENKPKNKYERMMGEINFRKLLRSIPKLFSDYNMNKRNNMKMRGRE